MPGRAARTGAYNAADGIYSTAEGSRFNFELATYGARIEGNPTNPTGTPAYVIHELGGGVVHNPFLIESLLRGSINQMKLDYGLTVSPGIDLNARLKQAPIVGRQAARSARMAR